MERRDSLAKESLYAMVHKELVLNKVTQGPQGRYHVACLHLQEHALNKQEPNMMVVMVVVMYAMVEK